jgi:hypothetical protein
LPSKLPRWRNKLLLKRLPQLLLRKESQLMKRYLSKLHNQLWNQRRMRKNHPNLNK